MSVEHDGRRSGAAEVEAGVESGALPAEMAAHEPSLAAIERRPLHEMLVIAAPVVVTMTSATLMQFVDGLMVSRIGPDPAYMTAQGNGGMLAWLMMAMVLGLTGVVNTFVSQNLGAGRPREGAAYAWNALWLSVAAWVVLMLPTAVFAPEVFAARDWVVRRAAGEGAMGPENAALLGYQVDYARVMLVGGVFVVGARGIGHYFYGMHRPTVVMLAALLGNVVNVVCNVVLIYGAEGMQHGDEPFYKAVSEAGVAVAGLVGAPALGVKGAAIATVIGAAVEFVIPLAVFLGPTYAKKFGTRAAWRVSWAKVRDILRLGWPGGAMFANEMVCWFYLMAVLLAAGGQAAGEDPTVHNKAGWIGLRFMHLSFMPAVGLSIAVTAIVGKCMGMGRPDLASSRAWLGVRIALVYMGACAVCFVLFRGALIDWFAPPGMDAGARAELVRIGSMVMIAAAVFQLFDAVAIVLSGALRGAGDTVWPGVATIVLSWVCIVAGGHALIWLAPGLGSLGPWIGASAYIVLLGVALLARFAAGRWRSIRLVEAGPGAGRA